MDKMLIFLRFWKVFGVKHWYSLGFGRFLDAPGTPSGTVCVRAHQKRRSPGTQGGRAGTPCGGSETTLLHSCSVRSRLLGCWGRFALFDQIYGRPEFDSEQVRILKCLMRHKQIGGGICATQLDRFGPKKPQIRIEDLDVAHFGAGIINICMNLSIRSLRETKRQPQAGVAPWLGWS